MDVSSIIYQAMQSGEILNNASRLHTKVEIPIRLVSMSVYSPGIVYSGGAGNRTSVSFSSNNAPRIAISLSSGKGTGPTRRWGI
jgi:hypothetical protein